MLLTLLLVDGAEVGVGLSGLTIVTPLKLAGLESALRKSVYAVGGLMGVLMPSSSLIVNGVPGYGLRGSSEGSTPDVGVLRVRSVGLTVAMMTMMLMMQSFFSLVTSAWL